MRVLNFGSLNLDYVYSVDHILIPGETLTSDSRNTFCGGKGLNQSIALARAGIPVYHAGMIGEGGEILLEACRENGVDTQFIRQVEGPCGHTVIQVERTGQNCILLFSGANRQITREFVDEVFESFGEGDILLLQNEISQLDYIIEKGFQAGMNVILNPSPYDSRLEECDLGKVSLFLMNEIEGFQITGEEEPERILEKMKAMYPRSKVMLTLGKDGSLYQDETGLYRQKAYKAEAIDTTAAGDTFTGYFIASIIRGLPVQEGMDLASKASGIAVTRPGATASIPFMAEVEQK